MLTRCHIFLALGEIRKVWRLCWQHVRHRSVHYFLLSQDQTTNRILSLLYLTGCGLATLEVAANSYISVLGTPKYAAARLNFSQGFQGIASFAGPLIASRWFFRGKNATTLDTVQWSAK